MGAVDPLPLILAIVHFRCSPCFGALLGTRVQMTAKRADCIRRILDLELQASPRTLAGLDREEQFERLYKLVSKVLVCVW